MSKLSEIIKHIFPSDQSKDEVANSTSAVRLLIATKLVEPTVAEEWCIKVSLAFYRTNSTCIQTEQIFVLLLKKSNLEQGDKAQALGLFKDAQRVESSYATAKLLVEDYNEYNERRLIAEKLTTAAAALESGYTDPNTKLVYEGNEGALLQLRDLIFNNPFQKENTGVVEGDISSDESIREALSDYDARKNGLIQEGVIETGYTKIDERAGMLKNGDLILIIAATAELKSTLAANIAYNNFIKGKNVIIFTAETARKTYARRFYSRHSCDPRFGSFGLDSNKIRDGKLTEEEEKQYLEAMDDFAHNPAYGYLNIVQMTQGATLDFVATKMEEVNRHHPLDLCVVDYLELMTSTRKRQSRREEIESLLIESKEIALTFNNGKGIPIIDLHQASQQAREEVKDDNDKFYTVRDAAHTSEAGKSSDLMLGILFDDELRAKNECAVKLLKCRDGAPGELFHLFVRPESSLIGNLG